jgi:CRP/FNR family transcriptional regulator, cyclic AMP receptor protein
LFRAPQATIRVLEADPELGLRLPPEQIARAREGLLAPVQNLSPGVCESPPDPGPGHLGSLILEGLIARDLMLAGNVSTELLGEGDLIEPWAADGEGLVHYRVRWHILSPVSVAVLDLGFVRLLREWPQVFGAFLERALRRTLRMAVHQALLQLSPVETRLLVLFWHLADRWGRVTRDGILLPLGLTHQVLGQLVGCQRASVTTALKEISRSGRAVHRPDGSWLLRGDPPDELSRLSWSREPVPAGGALMLR